MKQSKIKMVVASISLTAVSVGAIAIGYAVDQKGIQDITPLKADSYTLTINDGLTVVSEAATVTSTSGSNFSFTVTSYTSGSGKVGTLASGGTILNTTVINGITSVAVTLESGTVELYHGWTPYGSTVSYSSSPTEVTGASTGTLDLSSINAGYFKIYASADSVITSIIVSYSCAAPTTVSNFRLTVLAPTVGSSDSVSDTNYVWVNTDIMAQGTWSNYCMTKDTDNSWYYDFANVPVNTTTQMTFGLCLSDNTTAPDWGYQWTAGSWGIYMYPGQTELSGVSATFSSQPTVASSTYTLSVTINVSGTFSNFGNIIFIYNTTDSASTYTWPDAISSSQASSYTTSVTNLDTSKTLYFKVYIWDSVIGNCYVGDTSGANFSLTPSGGSTESVTINFVYPTTTSTVGTLGEVQSTSPSSMSFADQTTSVYGTSITISPTFDEGTDTFTASYSGTDIRIDDNSTIVGLKAGTSTDVTLTSSGGLTCTFSVSVPSSTYSSNYDSLNSAWATNEGWFNDVSVSEISAMGSDFANGIDISSCKDLYDNGSKFYNASGVEQSLFYILKEAGVNWVRLRLWNDPAEDTFEYGGGNCDLANVTWMAHEAKAAGLHVLLDFHYSDFWAHPSQQVLPKAWKSLSSVTAIAAAIKSYTTSTLNTLSDADALPDMVQLGNELTTGICLQTPGSESTTLDSNYKPSYLYNSSSISSSLSGSTSSLSNLKAYLTAASEGVDAVSSSIKKMIHWAPGSVFSASVVNTFFNNLSTVDYDVAGISAYPFYHYSSGLSALNTVLSGISIANSRGTVPWCIAETSYPFTSNSYVYVSGTGTSVTNHAVSSSSYTAISGYAYTISGQAKMLRDITNSVVSYGGIGVFYWEGAWVPNSSVGWASEGSPCTWSNQGFFSYDGKALGSLEVYSQMNPNI